MCYTFDRYPFDNRYYFIVTFSYYPVGDGKMQNCDLAGESWCIWV